MNISRALHLLAVLTVAADAGRVFAAANAATRPAARVVATYDPVANTRKSIESMPDGGKYRLSDLVRIRSASGMLVVEPQPAARKQGNHRITIEGSDAKWTLMYFGQAGGVDQVFINRYDFEEAARGGIWQISLRTFGGGCYFTAQAGSGADTANVNLHLANNQIRLTVSRRQAGRINQPLNVVASSFAELYARHPDECRRYVRPMLKRFAGEDPLAIKAADAYRLFPELQPDPRVMGQVMELLSALDSPVAAERNRASQALARLGAPGVLAVLRMDRAFLTPEQHARLDEFIAAHDDRRFADADEARKDPWVLVDCLEFDDPAVRTAARAVLAALLGGDVKFDPLAPPEARSAAADRLRDRLAKLPASTRPAATRPADQPLRIAPHS